MKILGVGVDIVKSSRIKKNLFSNKLNLKKRIFTKNEIKFCQKKNNKVNCYSKRFAAKEAFVKALGIGFRKKINFKDIEILNDTYGKPYLLLNKKMLRKIKTIYRVKGINIFLSISDEKEYSIANVIVTTK